jgi:hypothetical protein
MSREHDSGHDDCGDGCEPLHNNPSRARTGNEPAPGVVTREHRKVAAALVRESDGNPSLAAWVSDGDVNEGNWWICDACVMDAAQAIADAEARGYARAQRP